VNFMTGTIPTVREIVIVIADLYLPAGSTEAVAGTSGTSPGLEHVARFGRRRTLDGEGGWRAWLARWIGREDLANVPPAVMATAALDRRPVVAAATESVGAQAASMSSAPGVGARAATAPAQGPPSTVWLATPVHLIAGLTSLHLDRRSLLQLSPAELEGFAADFNQTFGGGNPAEALRLQPLPPSGQFLLQAPANLKATTTEPALALVTDVEASLPKGPQAAPFKRLGAELEIWLHSHPLNEARRRRGELPVSTLWLWGGGPAPTPAHGASDPGARQDSASHPDPTTMAFGNDAYLFGLSSISGAGVRALPSELAQVIDHSQAQRAVVVTELTPLLHAQPQWTVFDAVADLDRRYIAPALTALTDDRLQGVSLIANNMALRVERSDRLKFWRRRRPGLAGLTAGPAKTQ
jgi:hypothetical protein